MRFPRILPMQAASRRESAQMMRHAAAAQKKRRPKPERETPLMKFLEGAKAGAKLRHYFEKLRGPEKIVFTEKEWRELRDAIKAGKKLSPAEKARLERKLALAHGKKAA